MNYTFISIRMIKIRCIDKRFINSQEEIFVTNGDAIWKAQDQTNLEENGLLCLSGIRPGEVESLKAAYDDSIEWIDDQYAELSATETTNCIESYGFDCGRWARVVGRKKVQNSDSFIQQMSDLAVS